MSNACRIARCYDEAVAAFWQGDGADLREIGDWLASAWGDGPPEPAAPPIATSVCGAGGRGIRWYDAGIDVLGYVPGLVGCYRLPVAAIGGWTERHPAPGPTTALPARRPSLRLLRPAS